jgi:hypothetical protein
MKKHLLLLYLIFITFFSCEKKEYLSESNEIIEFTFRAEDNKSLKTDCKGTIDNYNIFVSVPYDAKTEELVAYINSNGIRIEIEDLIQESSVTMNNFNEIVLYDIIAENGNKSTYNVEVSIENTNCIDGNPDYNPFTFNPENYECADYVPTEYCPIAPTVSAKFESNKKIIFEPIDFDKSYGGPFLDTYNVDITEGEKIVFSYTYHYQGRDFQSFTYETIIFEINNNIDDFLISGRNLLNLNGFYHYASPYGPRGKVLVGKGCIKGMKINENEWQIDMNIITEIKEENNESHFGREMISEIFTKVN